MMHVKWTVGFQKFQSTHEEVFEMLSNVKYIGKDVGTLLVFSRSQGETNILCVYLIREW